MHLELKDFKEESETIIEQLHTLATENLETEFLLIHMAQAKVEQARDLLEKHNNIYFITSMSDAIDIALTRKMLRKGYVAQVGWENMFNKLPTAAPYKGWFTDYLPQMQWRKE